MKKVILTIVFVIGLLLFAIIIDYLLLVLMDSVVFKLLNFFNSFGLFAKLLTIFIGGTIIISALFYIFGLLAVFVKAFIFDRLPENNFILIFSVVLFFANVILEIKVLWDSFPSFGFWTTLEFLMLIGCIFSVNYVFISWTKKEN